MQLSIFKPPNSTSPKTSQTLLNDEFIHRLAITQSAGLGTLYDARKDCVVGNIPLGKTTLYKPIYYKSVQCTVLKDTLIEDGSLFHTINGDDDVWLSLVLNMIPPEGIASLVNPPFLIDTRTRVLHYYYISEEKCITDQPSKVRDCIPTSIPEIEATHVIARMKSGIHAVVVLQLPTNDESDLHRLLDRIAEGLTEHKFDVTKTEQHLLNRVVLKNVFSNISDLNKISNLKDICQKILSMKLHTFNHRPLEFALRPVTWFYRSYPKEKAKYIPLELESINIIKQHLLPLLSKMKELEMSMLDVEIQQTVEEHLNGQSDVFRQLSKITKDSYDVEIERVRNLVLQIRSGKLQQKSMAEILSNESDESLKNSIDLAQKHLHSLREKAQIINKYKQQNIKYLNMQRYSIQQIDDINTIFRELLRTHKEELVFCSTDDLRDQNSSIWNDQFRQWMNESEINSSMTLVYADFSYSTFHLPNTMILPVTSTDNIGKQFAFSNLLTPSNPEITRLSKKQSRSGQQVLGSSESPDYSNRESTPPSVEQRITMGVQLEPWDSTTSSLNIYLRSKQKRKDDNELSNSTIPSRQSGLEDTSNHMNNLNDTQNPPSPSTSQVSPRERRPRGSPSLPTIKYTNILLLGESGVGKSTFVNALVNYLNFETLEQAHSSQPLVLMPVSFLITVGDNFEEKIVRFGDGDLNEDHDHPGQSVTQHCRSYIFQIGSQTKLRIIDTPGMGDTRGLDQDDLNMQHILSFINNLPHLNAICIFLKPNESKLNIVLRSYFTRLLNFLGDNARKNIVFCFTNTRGPSFTSGSTGPLLREVVDKLSGKGIPFMKPNTFFFDNRSFRYFIACKNGIQFDSFLFKKLQRSWETSVNESNRLLEYICSKLKPYPQNEWQSIEHAQFTIHQMTRPLLETVRNILRNITLLKEKSSRHLIKLRPIVLSQPSAICNDNACVRTPQRYSDFWIMPDEIHIIFDKCDKCSCDRKKHIDIDYKLEYELYAYDGAESLNTMMSDFNQLKLAILEFARVYTNTSNTSKPSDPIVSNIKRMIDEERRICSQKNSLCFNTSLRDALILLKEEYKERRTSLISTFVPIDLRNIYEQIKTISKIDQIDKQINVIKQAKEKYMMQHEKQVP